MIRWIWPLKYILYSPKIHNEIQTSNGFWSAHQRVFSCQDFCSCHCSWIFVQRICTDTKPSRASTSLPAAPSPLRLWLGRSWGLTFHFSDPLFHRTNSYAGLGTCYMRLGETKIKGNSKIIYDSRCKVISALRLPVLFISMTSPLP